MRLLCDADKDSSRVATVQNMDFVRDDTQRNWRKILAAVVDDKNCVTIDRYLERHDERETRERIAIRPGSRALVLPYTE